MKLIMLPKNRFAKVDDDIFDFLSQWHWTYDGHYAVRHQGTWPNLKKFYMHRVVMDTPVGMDTDHINGDKLDNQRSNLRVCTHAENLANGKHRSNNTSGHRGVSWDKKYEKWQVNIWKNGLQISIGRYSSIEDAKAAYNTAAEKYHGKFAGQKH